MNNEQMNNQGEINQQPMMAGEMPQQAAPKTGGNAIMDKIKNFNIKDPNSLILLLPIALIVIIILVLFINLVGTKTLKCNSEDESNGIVSKTQEVVKFKFGHIKSRYNKTVVDFSDSDMDKDDLKDQIKTMKKYLKENCKSKDGCKYTFKEGKKKLTYSVKRTYDKDAQEDFEDNYDTFKDYKEIFDDACDAKK